MRKTKIICTLGPAVDTDEKISLLIENGMNCARLNFSHGTYKEHKQRIARLKKISRKMDKTVAIMLDTKGPEIRIGDFAEDFVILNEGDRFTLTTDSQVLGDSHQVFVTYKEMYKKVKEKTNILIDDGRISLEVIEIIKEKIICKVITGGRLSNKKSINIPDIDIDMPYLSETDCHDILFGIVEGVDFIAASFVRKREDVEQLRNFLNANDGSDIQIISKIECKKGVENFKDILKVSDGIMVARGDLGVEIPFKEIPSLQKKIIRNCISSGKIAITATQMLESMIESPRPTRAEVSDVANAVYDGTSAVMLSGESAAGEYPIEAVRVMAEIVKETENAIDYNKEFTNNKCILQRQILDTTCLAACTAAQYMEAEAIVAITRTGKTAAFLSDFRPNCPIIATTVSGIGRRQLCLRWGVFPKFAKEIRKTDELIEYGLREAKETGIVKKGDMVVVVIGSASTPRGISDTMRVCKIN